MREASPTEEDAEKKRMEENKTKERKERERGDEQTTTTTEGAGNIREGRPKDRATTTTKINERRDNNTGRIMRFLEQAAQRNERKVEGRTHLTKMNEMRDDEDDEMRRGLGNVRDRLERYEAREHRHEKHNGGLCNLGSQLLEMEAEIEERAVAVRIREVRAQHDELVERGRELREIRVRRQEREERRLREELRAKRKERREKREGKNPREEWSGCAPDKVESGRDEDSDEDEENTTSGESGRDCVHCGGNWEGC